MKQQSSTHTVEVQINGGPWATHPTTVDGLEATLTALAPNWPEDEVQIRHLLPNGTPKRCTRCCAE